MLNVSELSITINKRDILHDISLDVDDGRVCALIGPNGAGKSTLLKAISGILPPTRGSITIDGRALGTASRRGLAQKLSYLPQNTLPVPCSVFDAILLGRKPYIHWRPSRRDHLVVEEVVEEMGLEGLKRACVTEVSGGEFQKILIARSLVQGANVLVLDEPINHLDIKNQIDIMALIRKLTREKSLTTLIVLHDINLALRYADSILLIRDGKSLFHGGSRDISHEDLSMAYEIPVSLKRLDDVIHVLY